MSFHLFLSFFLPHSHFISSLCTLVYSCILPYITCRRAVEQATEPGLASITAYVSQDCTGTDNGFENATLLFYISSWWDFIRTLFLLPLIGLLLFSLTLLSVQCRCHWHPQVKVLCSEFRQSFTNGQPRPNLHPIGQPSPSLHPIGLPRCHYPYPSSVGWG